MQIPLVVRALGGVLSAALPLVVAGNAAGQQDDTPSVIPVLPEVVVEAPPPVFPAVPAAPVAPSLLERSVFEPPSVDGYRADSSTTGTLIRVPDIAFPGTVNVVPRDLLNDQQARQLHDAVCNSGATIGVGDGLFADRIFIRGLEVRNRDFRTDGFIDPTFTPRDFANIDRVEILKGPASVLYGSAAPSGTVNFITKKPRDQAFSDFRFQFGDFGQQRYALDANGRLLGSGELLYRVNTAYEGAGGFRDFDFLERTIVAPAVTWVIGADTMLAWQGEFRRHDTLGDCGVPVVGGRTLALPRSRYVGEPANDFLHAEDYRQTLVLTHQINECWQVRIGGSSLFGDLKSSQTYAVAQAGETEFARARIPGECTNKLTR